MFSNRQGCLKFLIPLRKGRTNMFQIQNDSENEIFYATTNSAGFDICANDELEIAPGEWRLVKTGLRILEAASPQIAELSSFGKILPELQIRPRSGMAVKFGVSLLNTPATIDADYRGEIQVMLVNFGKEVFKVFRGDRIAQGVVALTFQCPNIPVKNAVRGEGGFGSSGLKSDK
jgi:dUTP pyrophosphatase